MRNILFLIYRLYGGGAERVVSNMSIELENTYNIKIAVFDNLEKTYPFKGELIRIKLPFSDDPVTNSPIKRAIRFIVLIYKVRQIKRDNNIDVSISFAEQANIVNMLTKGKRKTIVGVRTLLSRELLNFRKMRVLKFLITYLYNHASKVVVPSVVAGKDLTTAFKISEQKIKVIYNYIDHGRVNGLSESKLEDDFSRKLFDQDVLLNIGRITPAKGQWLLFRISKKLKEKGRNLKIVIVGEGESEIDFKNKLIAEAKNEGIRLYDHSAGMPVSMDYDVYFLGFQQNPFMYMRYSKILLFPSVYEGFPNTILESMQTGLPVIAANCYSGIREILSPDTALQFNSSKNEFTPYGILSPALSDTNISTTIPDALVEEWVTAIDTLLNDRELRNGIIENGYKRASEFNKESILEQWKNCIGHS